MAPIANGEEGWEWAEEREGKELGGVVVAICVGHRRRWLYMAVRGLIIDIFGFVMFLLVILQISQNEEKKLKILMGLKRTNLGSNRVTCRERMCFFQHTPTPL